MPRFPFPKLLMCALFLSGFAGLCAAETVYSYKSFYEKTGEVVDYFDFTLGDIVDGKRTVRSQNLTSGDDEQYVLGEDYATLSWTVFFPKDKTEHDGARKGNVLVVHGQLKGNPVDKKIKIDERPFYFNPKLGLTGFVKSDVQTIEFWGLRHDTFAKFKMRAVKKGLEVIRVNGEDVEALRIDWAPIGIGALFFNRTYWYQPSSHMFLKQTGSNGLTRALFSKKQQL